MTTPLSTPSAPNLAPLVSGVNKVKSGKANKVLVLVIVFLGICLSIGLGYGLATDFTFRRIPLSHSEAYLDGRLELKGSIIGVNEKSLTLEVGGKRYNYPLSNEITVYAGPADAHAYQLSELKDKLTLRKPAFITVQLIDQDLKVTHISYEFEMTNLPVITPQPDTTGPGSDKLDGPLGIPKKSAAPSSDAKESTTSAN